MRIFPTSLLLLGLMAGSGLAQADMPQRDSSSALGGPTVFSASTVRDFLAACRADQSGCKDAVGGALMDKMTFDGRADICLQSVDYGAAVPQWLSAHPQMATMAAEDGIYAALKALYPC